MNVAHPHTAEAFWLLYFHGDRDDILTGATTTLSAMFYPSNQSLINLYLAQQWLTLSTNHRDSVALQYRPCRAITRTERTLQGLCRHPVFRRGKVPRGLEPCCQRRAGLIEDRARPNAHMLLARRAHQPPSACPPRLIHLPTRRAEELPGPEQPLQVATAGNIVAEHRHKLAVRPRVVLASDQPSSLSSSNSR